MLRQKFCVGRGRPKTMRQSLTMDRCFQRPRWGSFPLARHSWSHGRCCYQLLLEVGCINHSAGLHVHIYQMKQSHKKGLGGFRTGTWLGQSKPQPEWKKKKRSCTYFLRWGSYVIQGDLDLSTLMRLTLNFWLFWLSFLSAGITSTCHLTEPKSKWCLECLDWSPVIYSWPFVCLKS